MPSDKPDAPPDEEPSGGAVALHIADWRNEAEYPIGDASLARWAWEFLRRNASYQADWRQVLETAPTVIGISGDPEQDLSASPVWGAMIAEYSILFPCDPARAANPFALRDAVKLVPHGRFAGDRAPNELAIIFELNRPIAGQLLRAKRLLDHRVARIQASRKASEAKGSRAQVAKYRVYLRILDANVAGAKDREIAEELFPREDIATATDRVRQGRKAATVLSTKGYLKLINGK